VSGNTFLLFKATSLRLNKCNCTFVSLYCYNYFFNSVSSLINNNFTLQSKHYRFHNIYTPLYASSLVYFIKYTFLLELLCDIISLFNGWDMMNNNLHVWRKLTQKTPKYNVNNLISIFLCYQLCVWSRRKWADDFHHILGSLSQASLLICIRYRGILYFVRKQYLYIVTYIRSGIHYIFKEIYDFKQCTHKLWTSLSVFISETLIIHLLQWHVIKVC
jgi:hypothetical protein